MAQAADATRYLEAAASGDLDTVRHELGQGVDVNAVNRQRTTAITLAALGNHLDVVRALIEAGADIDRQDNTRSNPFLVGCRTNNLPLVQLMVEAGADIDLFTRFGGVGIHPPAEKGYVELVRYLATHTEVNVNHTNWIGWTPLLEAVVLRDGGPDQQEIVRLLLDAGADPHLVDMYGKSPRELAEELGYTEIAALLAAAEA